jgi:uncharacterized protein YndB with AHSA1/START domain
MFDILQQIAAIHREVSRRPEGTTEMVSLVVRRTYDAAPTDVWSALTDPARLERWLFPISGDLRAGGKFQFEGNAGGDILACEPPKLLRVTYGAPTSVVVITLAKRGAERTELVLEHTVPIDIAGSGAGSLFVGPGWDTGLVALDLHLRGLLADAPAFHKSREVQDLGARSTDAWEAIVVASKTAQPDEIAAARAAALAHFAPDLSRQ